MNNYILKICWYHKSRCRCVFTCWLTCSCLCPFLLFIFSPFLLHHLYPPFTPSSIDMSTSPIFLLVLLQPFILGSGGVHFQWPSIDESEIPWPEDIDSSHYKNMLNYKLKLEDIDSSHIRICLIINWNKFIYNFDLPTNFTYKYLNFSY